MINHTTMSGLEMRCLHCGRSYEMAPSPSLSVACAAMAAFADEHEACEPSEAGAARMRYSTPEEWIRSWDTGESSKTIWYVMQRGHAPRVAVPQDPSDFGRCYRLLAAIPAWRARLGEMAGLHPWVPFVEAWPQLEKLYAEELPSGEAPKCYAAIRACVAKAER